MLIVIGLIVMQSASINIAKFNLEVGKKDIKLIFKIVIIG